MGSPISGLTNMGATVPEADDNLVVVDTSDTTQAPTGTTKRWEWQDFLRELSAAQLGPDTQRWTINFSADGDAYIPADVAMTIDAGVAAIGTGTLAYEKSTAAAPGTFSSTSLPATLEAGAWLKITVSSLTGFKAVELKRTA